jgi:Zn-dependent protease with chaperone function
LNLVRHAVSKRDMNIDPTPHAGCALCALRSRRLFTGLLAGSALAGVTSAWGQPQDEGLRGEVGRESRFTKLVSAEQVEGAAQQQYAQMLGEYKQKGAVMPASHPQVVRLRAIAQRLTPFTTAWNGRAAQWRWEVNLLNDAQVNAFCMPGGKIAFYAGILVKLQLSDDEVATIMGHEMAHALREHARERMGKTAATRLGAGLLSSVLGMGQLGDVALNMGAQLLTLRFSREDETEADLVGMDLAARAGHDPAAGVTLWQKMMAAGQGASPQFLSTHPAGDTRIRDIQGKLPKVQPLFERAPKPPRNFGPPAAQRR